MAKEDTFELSSNMTGLSESPTLTMEEDGKVDVVYEADRCTAAWLEVKSAEGVSRKIPILPNSRNGSSPLKNLKQGDEFKLVASVGRSGFFRGFVSY